MSNFSFACPTVEFSAQGVTGYADPAEFHPFALEAIMTYGIRRWMQDHVNAQAHAFRKAKEEADAKGETFTGAFDPAAVIAARLDAAKTGVLSAPRNTAGPAFTPEQDATYAAAGTLRAVIPAIDKAWKACKGMTSDERKTAILAAVEYMPDADRAPIDAIAKVRLAAFASLSQTVTA